MNVRLLTMRTDVDIHMVCTYGDIVHVHSALDVGAVVRRRRREVGWSQLQLAQEVGVSRRWVTAFEQGKPSTELGIVLRTLAALGLSVDLVDTTVVHGAVDLDDLLAEYDAD